MTKPKTASWSKLLILLGDGAGPEVFTAPCGLTTKGIAFSADASETNVPDCDDPDLPSWVERNIRSLSAGVTGSGVLALDSHATWRTWFLSGASKNVRIKFDNVLADGGGYYAGAFILTRFEPVGNEADGKMQMSIAMESDGVVAWTAASA